MKKHICLILALILMMLPTAFAAEGEMVIGDTTFNPENGEPSVDPHDDYGGWACIRYGVGETLVRFSDTMELEPWLAESWENTDECTWVITLRSGVKFSSGRTMDAEAVKACFERLLSVHDRAPSDLCIESMEAEGQILTIHTSKPNPALMNSLGDPYACVIDVDAACDDGIASGTGPYIAVECVSGDHLVLEPNENYWNGEPQLKKLTVRNITDGSTLANALLSGEIDAAYGIAYESYPLFESGFNISRAETSREFFCRMNYASAVTSDPAVRRAIAMGIDKDAFADVLLEGNGSAAEGAFPEATAAGNGVKGLAYDPYAAAELLESAGWTDTDGDGIREKDGVRLTIRWLTYPSRQELPILAEYAQSALQKIGIDVIVNCTADHNSIVRDSSAWDVYAGAQVNIPTGDPGYWFNTCAVTGASKNFGAYSDARLDSMADELEGEFDTVRRSELAAQMQQIAIDDGAFVFCAFLRMGMISRADVSGYTAHPCDYYQVTADLAVSR